MNVFPGDLIIPTTTDSVEAHALRGDRLGWFVNYHSRLLCIAKLDSPLHNDFVVCVLSSSEGIGWFLVRQLCST